MWDTIAQVGIFVFGVLGIVLVARKNKWGFVFGLLSQPFWYITSIQNKQWGIVLVSVVYTGSWAYGIHEWFWKKEKA
jgi:nicotinamide riboside transporter PnuC